MSENMYEAFLDHQRFLQNARRHLYEISCLMPPTPHLDALLHSYRMKNWMNHERSGLDRMLVCSWGLRAESARRCAAGDFYRKHGVAVLDSGDGLVADWF